MKQTESHYIDFLVLVRDINGQLLRSSRRKTDKPSLGTGAHEQGRGLGASS